VRLAKLGVADSAPSPAAVAETFAGWLATRQIRARPALDDPFLRRRRTA
jgi:hypothetical protein